MVESMFSGLIALFTVLFTGFILLRLAKIYSSTIAMRSKSKLDAIRLKNNMQEAILDRPRPYIFRYITIPMNNRVGVNHNENEDVVTGQIHLDIGMGSVKITMFVSKPSEMIAKLKNSVEVDWENESFHLVNYETVDA